MRMKTIAVYEVTVSPTTFKKKLKDGIKKYEYGSISVKNPELAKYIGKKVKIRVTRMEDYNNDVQLNNISSSK